MATVTIKGRTIEVPDNKAEDFVAPIEERRNCNLVQGEPVIWKVDERWIQDPEWMQKYGPAFILARVNLEEDRQPIYIPPFGSPQIPDLLWMRSTTARTPLEFYNHLSGIVWPRKY